MKCARCGVEFDPPKNRKTPKYCTERCSNTAKSRIANGLPVNDAGVIRKAPRTGRRPKTIRWPD